MREIALPRTFDITAVTAVAAELSEAITAGSIRIDASAIIKLDAAALQLLCAAVAAARARDVTVDWHGVPAVLTDGAHTLALEDALGFVRTRSQENH